MPGLTLRLKVLPSTGPGRCHVVVPARLVKSAVTRHRIKRRLRAALRELLSPSRPGVNVVVSAGPAAATAPFRELVEVLRPLLKRASLL